MMTSLGVCLISPMICRAQQLQNAKKHHVRSSCVRFAKRIRRSKHQAGQQSQQICEKSNWSNKNINFRQCCSSLVRKVVFCSILVRSAMPPNLKSICFSLHCRQKSRVHRSQERGVQGIDVEQILVPFWKPWGLILGQSAPRERKMSFQKRH